MVLEITEELFNMHSARIHLQDVIGSEVLMIRAENPRLHAANPNSIGRSASVFDRTLLR